MLYQFKFKVFLFLILYCKINKAIYILSGLKTLNKFLYNSRFKNYYIQKKGNSCSFSEGPNCYFSEKKYIQNYEQIKNYDWVNNGWVNFYNKTQNYDYKKILELYYINIKRYLEKNSRQIDKEQNSQGEVFKFLMTFDYFDEYTIKEDIYYNENLRKIFYNKEFIIDIKGKLKLSYNKDESEYYLNSINKDYPSNTYGIIESDHISISFRGKVFVCNYFYIKAHDEKSKSKQIFFYGYVGNRVVYTYSYQDNKKRNEKWLKVFFPSPTPINKLIISGPYDIDNISFTFPNKKYEDSNIYTMYNFKNIKKIIEDEDI